MLKMVNQFEKTAKDRGPFVLTVAIERFPIAGKFIISRGAKTEAAVVCVSIQDGEHVGRGECVPYTRYGETVESVVALIESIRKTIERRLTRQELQLVMPAGAARNAVDCALWDLEAKQSGSPVFRSAGLSPLRPVTTAYTISLDHPEAMREAIMKASGRPILKIKLGSPEGDLERIQIAREAAPNCTLIADANEGWTNTNVKMHLNACAEARFALVEQPLPVERDDVLKEIRMTRQSQKNSVAICADESVHDRRTLAELVDRYDFVNIKLDKTGGLTEALLLAQQAQQLGLGIMIGCMVGTSLAMAPALMLSTHAQFVDLDGPLLLAQDRECGLRYEGSLVYPPEPRLWG